MARAQVRLNVYDMYWLNEYASNVGVGIFHSGIEVYGIEYAYGGHPFTFSGVFENSPQDAEELGENFKFRESISIGETDFTAAEVRTLIKEIGKDFRGDKYHLISRNCNHFTAAFAKELTGKEIPGWINRLAAISGSIPFLERMLPQEWLTPVALQQSIDERDRERDRERERQRERRVESIEKAEEATESAIRRQLNDSQTTMLNGYAGRGSLTTHHEDASSSSSSSSDVSSSPSITRCNTDASINDGDVYYRPRVRFIEKEVHTHLSVTCFLRFFSLLFGSYSRITM
ncbi:unnamed protein product, partial [Mesorhabditis belari]|uniref:PPPDE domain-containing protein n=1 Tax=Mesorhabditis belari TaxID=2138241 RepID=A0AAF3ELV8_9BILA